jgi:hypothetical protein
MIEVIYEVRFPSGDPSSLFSESARVLRLLSATRTDTRTTVQLTEEEDSFCMSRASEKSMEID